MERIIKQTDDGSATLFVPELNEHYHSVKGAQTESQHIFIQTALQHTQTTSPHILEIGFGTGLNAFLTLMEAERSQRCVHYTGIELYPLEWNTISALKYSDDPRFKQIHIAPWEVKVAITSTFRLLKKQTDFTQIYLNTDPETRYDVIYFDAFAPEKQPEMWEQGLFNHLYSILNDNGVLSTYCAKGVVRRMLQQAGFVVERLPGPPGGKREILRACKTLI